MKNYYQILGVEPSAGFDEIRKAYRQLVFRFHPDMFQNRKASVAAFHEITEAYKILSNPIERKRYHQKLFTMGYNTEIIVLTPMQSYEALLNFYETLNNADFQRIPQQYIIAELNAIATPSVMEEIALNENLHFKEAFIRLYLKCSRLLHYHSFLSLIPGLKLISSKEMEWEIKNMADEKRQEYLWEKYKIPIAILMAIFISVIIYYGAAKK